MNMYTLLASTTLAALQTADQAPSVHDGLERASCQPVNARCTGLSQSQADAQCCPSSDSEVYCHVETVDWDSGLMVGFCQTFWECSNESQGKADDSAYKAEVKAIAETKLSASCQPVNARCGGFSQDQANAQCCNDNCYVYLDLNGHLVGYCDGAETAKVKAIAETKPSASCQPVNARCTGLSQDQANAQCCSNNCHAYLDLNGRMVGYCDGDARTGAAAVEQVGDVKALEDPQNAPGSCRKNDRPCFGYSQGPADGMCCSAYCHVMSVDGATGQMKGLCQTDCKLRGQSCSGKSQYKADAKCCSGSCGVTGVDAKGNLYGTCEGATPACKPLTMACSGKYINDADAQCCSGNCGHLVFLNGQFHGRCERATLFAEDGQPNAKQPAVESQKSSAGEA